MSDVEATRTNWCSPRQILESRVAVSGSITKEGCLQICTLDSNHSIIIKIDLCHQVIDIIDRHVETCQ